MDTMNRHYFSKQYRSFTIQQTNMGWEIVNCPNWTRSGPVPSGPFATDGIARHVIDNILDDPMDRIRQEQNVGIHRIPREKERARRESDMIEELSARNSSRPRRSSGRYDFADKLEFFISDLVNYAIVFGVGIWIIASIYDAIVR